MIEWAHAFGPYDGLVTFARVPVFRRREAPTVGGSASSVT
jgi:hypothetical protein